MTDIALTASAIANAHADHRQIIYPYIAAEAITAGQCVFLDSNGKVQLADADAGGEFQVAGIALNAAGADGAVSVMERGYIYGFTVSGLAYNAIVYVSVTPGALADASGGTTVVVGRIRPFSDSDLTKVLYLTVRTSSDWA